MSIQTSAAANGARGVENEIPVRPCHPQSPERYQYNSNRSFLDAPIRKESPGQLSGMSPPVPPHSWYVPTAMTNPSKPPTPYAGLFETVWVNGEFCLTCYWNTPRVMSHLAAYD